MKKDEKDVSALEDTVDGNWTNPFGVPSELISLSTGIVAPDSITKDKVKDTVAFKDFCDERFHVSDTKGFFCLIKKQTEDLQ